MELQKLTREELLLNTISHFNVNNRDFDSKLPERLKDMGDDFLSEIQNLHDLEKFWDENGLTENGYTQARYIISYYNLDLKL